MTSDNCSGNGPLALHRALGEWPPSTVAGSMHPYDKVLPDWSKTTILGVKEIKNSLYIQFEENGQEFGSAITVDDKDILRRAKLLIENSIGKHVLEIRDQQLPE